MKFTRQLLSIAALFLGTFALVSAQTPAGPAAPAERPDQISQLAAMVGLSDEQEQEIRDIIGSMEPELERLQTEAQVLQAELVEMAGPDFDEEAIRKKAAELGALEGKMTANSLILQSKVDAVFTEEQREQLEEMQRQQQQMQQQMQQQQMQRQIQQQMQQMQQQQQQSEAAKAVEAVEAAE